MWDEWRRVSHCPINWWAFLLKMFLVKDHSSHRVWVGRILRPQVDGDKRFTWIQYLMGVLLSCSTAYCVANLCSSYSSNQRRGCDDYGCGNYGASRFIIKFNTVTNITESNCNSLAVPERPISRNASTKPSPLRPFRLCQLELRALSSVTPVNSGCTTAQDAHITAVAYLFIGEFAALCADDFKCDRVSCQ